MEGRSRHGGPSAANHAGQTKQMADGLHILPRDLVLLAGTLSGGIIRWATSCQSGMCSGVAPIRLLRVLLQVQESWRRRRWISIHWGRPPAGIASSRAVPYHFDIWSGLDGWEPGAAEGRACEEDPTRKPGSHYLDRRATVHLDKMCSAADCRPVHCPAGITLGKEAECSSGLGRACTRDMVQSFFFLGRESAVSVEKSAAEHTDHSHSACGEGPSRPHLLYYQSGRTGSRVLGWWKFAEASQKIAIILIANPRISSQLSVSREILNTGKFLVPAFD